MICSKHDRSDFTNNPCPVCESEKNFKKFLDGSLVPCVETEEHCLMEAFFKHQESLPPHMRTNVEHLYCPCRRCNPARL